MTEREMFEAALELPLADRDAYLDRVCETDGALRQRLAGLLGKHDRASSFLEEPAVAALATLDEPAVCEQPGALIGSYKLLEQIGEGGFGVVFMAEQQQPIRRQVALKVLKPGMDSKQVIARFEAERQALALMDHPNIATVLDAGHTDSGRPYFAMELVKGVPITDYCDQARLTPRERLELFVPVCQAVQHAHQKGIIHRDLKPANVLVTLQDGAALVKVIDFGIAKALGQQLTDKTLFTGFAQLIGTPLYMSPEQAALSNVDVDTRSDVYSLGVLLYELLTGTTPFDEERLRQAGYDEWRRIIREEEPPRPSTRISTLGPAAATVATRRQSDPKRLGQLFRRELDWIVMKCLEKDRNRRYETVGALAADLQHYLRDEPVQARPPSTVYRFQKFARRNKRALVTLTVLGATLLTAVVGLSIALVAVKRAGDQARAALDAEARRRKQTRTALDALSSHLIDEWLTTQPQLLPEHKQFLESALKSYEEFAADTGQDRESRAGVAAAYFRVGVIRRTLGQVKEAEEAFEHSVKLYAGLAGEFPSEPDYRRALAHSQTMRGQHMMSMGRTQEGQKALGQAVAVHKELIAEFPAVHAYRDDLAWSCNIHGHLLKDLGQAREAEQAYRQARDIERELVGLFPAIPRYRWILAKSQHYLALLLETTGRIGEGEEAYRQAQEIQAQLAADFPAAPDYRRDLAITCSDLGNLLKSTSRIGEAEAAYREALALQKQLAAEHPTVPAERGHLATSYNNLGLLFETTRRFPQAEEAYGQALAIQKQLVANFPATHPYRQDLARTHNNLGLLFKRLGRLREAEQALRQALAVWKGLVADSPRQAGIWRGLAVTQNNLGNVLRDAGHPVEAEEAYRQALATHRQLAEEFPTVPDHQNELAGTLVNLARFLLTRKDPQTARQLLDEALPHHYAALRANPRNPVYRQFYRNNRKLLTLGLLNLEDHTAAAEAAGELVDAAVDLPQDAFHAACVLGCCTRLAGKDQRLPAERRPELAQSYADRAVAFLRQALAKGYKNLEVLKKHPDLEPLRSRQDFQALVASLEKVQ
jgi:serine/threonine protein kinase/tetratricopeptide (TPR) repeat protein